MFYHSKRICPHCKTEIPAAATVCASCTRDVHPVKALSAGKITLAVLTVIFVSALLRGASPTSAPKAAPAPKPADLVGRVQFDGRQFHIYNDDTRDWRACRADVNDGYRYEYGEIRHATVAHIGSLLLTDSDGRRFDAATFAPKTMDVRCEVAGGKAWLSVRWR